MQTPLPAAFYNRHVDVVARELLGMWLVRTHRSGLLVGEIVEVEAYRATGDSACHAHRGMTPRNRVMFGPPGRAYVYAIHSRWCLNTVTEEAGTPSAVLIRAIEPLAGMEIMSRLRGTSRTRDLARGPSRLCEALDIDKRLNGHRLMQARRLWIIRPPGKSEDSWTIARSPRIGVTSAHDLPLRFFREGSPYVSGPRTWPR